MVNNSKAFKLARYAIMLATIVVAMMLDRAIGIALTAGFSQQLSTAAFVLLVTFTFCFLDDSWLTAILSWTFFGLASFIKEFILPSSVATMPVYVWPLITMIPRIASGVVAFGAYKLIIYLSKKMPVMRKRQILAMVVAVLLGNITNTVLFLSTLNLFKVIFDVEFTALIELIKLAAYTNIIPEYSVTLVLVPFIVLGVRKGLKLGIDGDNWKRAKKDEQTAKAKQNTKEVEQ
ncbi:MAG: hypothetical protein J1G02_00910 [Clostridiales bacterium]|nr:hypothetical protein [Clostridiales bacterium]